MARVPKAFSAAARTAEAQSALHTWMQRHIWRCWVRLRQLYTDSDRLAKAAIAAHLTAGRSCATACRINKLVFLCVH